MLWIVSSVHDPFVDFSEGFSICWVCFFVLLLVFCLLIVVLVFSAIELKEMNQGTIPVLVALFVVIPVLSKSN